MAYIGIHGNCDNIVKVVIRTERLNVLVENGNLLLIVPARGYENGILLNDKCWCFKLQAVDSVHDVLEKHFTVFANLDRNVNKSCTI